MKRILLVNDDEECSLLLSYEKLFEVCFYCGKKRNEKHSCSADYDNGGCLLVDEIFEDESLVCPVDFPVSEETKKELHDGVMLLFPLPTLVDEFSSVEGVAHSHGDNTQEHFEEDEGWITVLVRRGRSANRGRGSARRDKRSYDNVVRGNRTWVSHADLVSNWCPMADEGSDTRVIGGKSGVAE